MKKNDIVKQIEKAEAERKRLVDGIQKQKKETEERQKDLQNRLQTMDPAASFEEFKKVKMEADTNEAYLKHLEYAGGQLKKATDSAKKEYKSIIDGLQADTDAEHKAAGAAIMDHLKALEKTINGILQENHQ